MVGHFSAVFMGMYFSSFFTIVDKSSNSDEIINKLKLKIKKFKMIIALSGIFVGSIIFRFLRGYLEPGQNLANFDMNMKVFFERSIESGDLGYAPVVMQLISLVPDTYDYLLGQSYFRLIFVVIPRAIWEKKPQNTQRIVASWLKPEIMGLTLPPGINGDSYINFGILGIVIMIFFGIFFKSIDSKLTLKNVLIWGSSPVWIFHLVRGGFTNPLLIFLVLYTINSFISKRCKVNELSDDLKS